VYGVIVKDEYKAALVRSLVAGKGSKDQYWVRVGDYIGDYILADVQADRIIIQGEDKKFEVFLHDRGKPRSKVAAAPKKAAPTVVTTSEAEQESPKQKVRRLMGKPREGDAVKRVPPELPERGGEAEREKETE
jgi:hypothetical protein